MEKLNEVIYENMKYLKSFVDKVYELQDDWNQTVSEMAQSLCEICLTKESRELLKRRIHDRKQNSMI